MGTSVLPLSYVFDPAPDICARGGQRGRDRRLHIAETIAHLSSAWELKAGDLIHTSTPEGVAAVVTGDTVLGAVAGLDAIRVRLADPFS